MKKKCMYICLAVVLLFQIGCSNGENVNNPAEQTEQLKIAISVYDQYDTFITSLVNQFQENARKKEKETGKGISVEVVSAGGKQSLQNDQVEEFIDKEYDVICVNLVDRTDPTMIIDKAKSADVPIVFFNRELVQEDLERWDKLYYVGAVALESGIMEGQLVVDYLKDNFDKVDKNKDGKIQYVILEGEAGHQDALVRTEYCIKTIQEANRPLEKLGDEIANWSRAQAATKMNVWLDNFGHKIELVLANNDDMALGSIDAWKESGRRDWPAIVGIDGTKEALEAVENGEMIGTVLNDADGQAYSMLELAYSLKYNTQLPESITLENGIYIRLPHSSVTSQNVKEFLDSK